jgi:hypothetical protein
MESSYSQHKPNWPNTTIQKPRFRFNERGEAECSQLHPYLHKRNRRFLNLSHCNLVGHCIVCRLALLALFGGVWKKNGCEGCVESFVIVDRRYAR